MLMYIFVSDMKNEKNEITLDFANAAPYFLF